MMQKLVWPAFILMVAAQWFVPARLVLQTEHLLKTGKEFKFRTQPINPNEPIYGNTVYLSFKATSARSTSTDTLYTGDPVYVSLSVDSAGYAKITALSKEEPAGQTDFVLAAVDYALGDSTGLIYVKYPFDQMYLEAPKDAVHDGSVSFWEPDTTQVSYAIVMINKGHSALKDVIVDGTSLKHRKHNQ